MLSITRTVGQSFFIGEDIQIVLKKISSGGVVQVNVFAPKSIRILRSELKDNGSDYHQKRGALISLIKSGIIMAEDGNDSFDFKGYIELIDEIIYEFNRINSTSYDINSIICDLIT